MTGASPAQAESTGPTLTVLPLDHVLEHWRPGSHDRTWDEEFAAIASGGHDAALLALLRDLSDAANRGQPLPAPVLGWDGRVWAGHRRLWLYRTVGLTEVAVDVVEPGGRRSGWAGHCAPPDGQAP